MRYTVRLSKSAVKSLESIYDPVYSRIKQAIDNLADNPRPQGCKKLRGRDAYRIRVSDYRIIYEVIDLSLYVDIVAIGHRKNIY